MKELEERILKDGRVLPGNILKADSFLNHQIDPDLMQRIGETFADHFRSQGITKVLTIEASGIAPALMAACALHVPMVFAKKHGAHNIGNDFYTASVHSYTYDSDYTIIVSSSYLSSSDRVLCSTSARKQVLLHLASASASRRAFSQEAQSCVHWAMMS